MWEYTEKVKELFMNPKNIGPLEGANAIGEVGSLSCGDALKLYLKIENDVIVDASFETFGCASAIASSSALTEIIKGMTIEEASKLTNKDIAKYLDGLPKEKIHCSVMGEEALEAAIRNYKGLPPIKHAESKIVCFCFGVSEDQIRKVIRENELKTREDVTSAIKAGGGCGSCHDKIEEILAEENGTSTGGMTNVQRMQAVMRVLYTSFVQELRPGEDIEIIDVEESIVRVRINAQKERKLELKNAFEAACRAAIEDTIKISEIL